MVGPLGLKPGTNGLWVFLSIAVLASTPVSLSEICNMKAEELSSDDVVALRKSGGSFSLTNCREAARWYAEPRTRNDRGSRSVQE